VRGSHTKKLSDDDVKYDGAIDSLVSLGFESSPIVVDSYLYAGDNGGMFFCIDLNTMKLVWAKNIQDDLNATPVFEWGEDGKGYLYLATSLEYSPGICYMYKLDASNGNTIWEKTYSDIPYNYDVSGGALSSPLLGRNGTSMEGMILFHIARTPDYEEGILVALDKNTGEVIWEKVMGTYSWSTPTAVYDQNGIGYIIMCDASGYLSLIDSTNGETLDRTALGSNIEASPVVYNNTIVVGAKGAQIFAITIS
jgi:outer membrane protein assembly factor BamB